MMKKLIAIALAAVLVLSLAACGSINDKEVSILWADEGVIKTPDSLINAMERAMYTQNISYAHYGAKGDQAAQTKQAEEALNKGCAVLLVNLVDSSAAQTILDLAKGKNVPVVFFDCEVEASVLSGYDKCALVNTDESSVAEVLGRNIGEYLLKKNLFGTAYENWKKVDVNEDGKITYAFIGENSDADPMEAINKQLTDAEQPALVPVEVSDIAAIAAGCTEESRAVELVVTDDDLIAQELLIALQEKGYNENRLTTHCIPVYTVGDSADYKELVLANLPEGEYDSEAVQDYLEAKQYVADLRNVEEGDLETYIYTTRNVVGDGRLAGSAVEDYDSMAAAVAAITRNLIKGDDAMKDVEGAKDRTVLIEYTAV